MDEKLMTVVDLTLPKFAWIQASREEGERKKNLVKLD